MISLEVLFTPADFLALAGRDLSDTGCVVFDVLRATSSMVCALWNGASGILPVEGIPEALTARRKYPNVLLAGEREGVRIGSALTGGIAFDLGNSPREFTTEAVTGKTIIMTTTNGTRALRACGHAQTTLAACFLNLGATADAILSSALKRWLLVCSGTHEQAAYEDVLAAGGFCDVLWPYCQNARIADSALMARELFLFARPNLNEALSRSRNARRLLSLPELREDLAYCLRTDAFPLVAQVDREGLVRRS